MRHAALPCTSQRAPGELAVDRTRAQKTRELFSLSAFLFECTLGRVRTRCRSNAACFGVRRFTTHDAFTVVLDPLCVFIQLRQTRQLLNWSHHTKVWFCAVKDFEKRGGCLGSCPGAGEVLRVERNQGAASFGV